MAAEKESGSRSRPKRSVSMEKALEAIASGKVDPVYFFYASGSPPKSSDKGKGSPFNDYLMDRALELLRRQIVDGNEKDFNYSSFIAPDTPLSSVIAVAATYPMFRAKRLVIVKDVQEYRADDWQSAAAYLADPAPTSCLVLVGVHFPSANKGGEKARQLVLEHVTAVQFAPFSNKKEVLPFFREELSRRGKKIEKNAEDLLLDQIGFDLNELVQAIEKLDLYADGRPVINQEDVERCVARTRMETVWQLLDALAERKTGAAMASLSEVLENAKQEDEIALMGALIRLFRELHGIRVELDKGIPASKLAKELPGNSWAVEKRVRQTQAWNRAALADALLSLQRCDRAIRMSRVPGHVHFERFVLRACGALKGKMK